VIFGAGTLPRVAGEASRLGLSRLFLIATRSKAPLAQDLAATLGARVAALFLDARMHTPVEVTNEALAQVRALGADGVVVIGGGSAIGLGKAIAGRTELPQIVVPTTYSGSEATPILGELQDGRKVARRSSSFLPEVIVYDVELTYSLPVAFTVTSGMNAIAHAVEALYARDRNPIVTRQALQGMEALATALPVLVREPDNASARRSALFGAWVCGACLASVGMALHHKLCHALGGSFDLPHAETHTVVLPHATAYNERAARVELQPVADLLDSRTAAEGLWRLAQSLGAPGALAALGLREEDLDNVVRVTFEQPYWNPQPLVQDEVRKLLDNAYFGRPPDDAM
jgi:alcohol dehydrogenase class IV